MWSEKGSRKTAELCTRLWRAVGNIPGGRLVKLYWRLKKRGKWTWKAATLTPKGKPVPFVVEEEE